MENRRRFLKVSAAALTVAAARPLFGSGIQGANNRVRMAVIGCGNRAGRVFDSLARHADCQFLAAAEVNKAKLDQWMTPARQTFNLQVVGDYRRLLERRDIDAVLIATPDHWHRSRRSMRFGRQGRVRREAGVEHDRAHQRHARRLQEGEAGRPGRHAAAELGSLHRGEEGARQRRARQRHAHLHRAARLVRASQRGRTAGPCGARLGRVPGSGAAPALQAEPSGVPWLVRLRRRARRRLGRASRRRRPLVHECGHEGAAPDDAPSDRSWRSPTRIPNRCPTRSRSPGSTTTSS